MFEHSHIDFAVCFCNADSAAKISDCFRRISTAAYPRKRGHSRVVPAVDYAFVNELFQKAFAHNRAVYVEPCKLYLTRLLFKVAVVDKPIVKRSVIFKFKRTKRVSYSLYCVFERMRKIVHRINAPLIPRAMMSSPQNSVYNRVAHIYVRRRHIYFRSERLFAVGIFAVFHFFKKFKVLFDRTVSVRRLNACRRKRSAICANLVSRKVAHKSQTFLYENDCLFVHNVEIVGSIKFSVPAVTEPLDIFFYRFDVFDVFFRRICVVETQITFAVKFLFYAEVYRYCFCVSDMQIAVRFGRKTSDDFVVFARL